MSKRVLITRILPELAGKMLIENGFDVRIWDGENDLSAEALVQEAKNADTIITIGANRIDKEFLTSCRHLRLISQFAVGYDNIDVEAATALNIPVANTPDAVTEATADIAFLLMQSVARKSMWLHKEILKGNWKRFEPVKNLGAELRGKTLGIFGLGRIGLAMARRCKGAFGMNVIYHNRNRNIEGEKEVGAQWVNFQDLLNQSDVISVHSVLSNETRGRFGAKEFQAMKRSVIFINTSRGGVVNESDLEHALKSRMIWGAGLDVTDPEPMRKDHPLLELDNVCILPHVGSGTVETRNEMARVAAQNIISYYETGAPVYCVNPTTLKKS
ncbi:MAG: D-glycerate dehydrogenase [Bacteroidetes bacterium]|nr:D-glycerate dehydrogenase [Bacteroidota bacterium]